WCRCCCRSNTKAHPDVRRHESSYPPPAAHTATSVPPADPAPSASATPARVLGEVCRLLGQILLQCERRGVELIGGQGQRHCCDGATAQNISQHPATIDCLHRSLLSCLYLRGDAPLCAARGVAF